MSTNDSDDLEASGYFLSEGSQLRLTKLREYVAFLANLARPRRSDEPQEGAAEIRMGEVAVCLELLKEQIGQVLDELSRPAARGNREALRTGDAAPVTGEAEAAEEEGDNAGSPRYVFGVTLGQIDEINLLLDMIRAHGDVVIADGDAEFADHTLSQMGHAIFCDAEKLRDIIGDVNAQQLRPMRGTQTGVREAWATYHALPACVPMGSVSPVVQPLLTYQ